MLCKRNGKRCSCATTEVCSHLGGLLSTKEASYSRTRRLLRFFWLSNLPRAYITPWLHAARLPFLNFKLNLKLF